ncbi:hypothetical protein Hpkin5_05510 [Helicobacter pylori]
MLFFMLPKRLILRKKEKKGKRGTIEKIQKQLDSQTEVWTIFNKPINSPRALKDELVNDSEKESLKILNKEMKNILGKHYKGHKVVSAQAAFYGLSQALIPGTDFDEKKQKFLEIFKTTQAEIPNIFSVWDECFSSAWFQG